MIWEVYSIKYAERNARTRVDSFLMDPNHMQPHDMDYNFWVLRRGKEVILVDTGFDADENARRNNRHDLLIDPRAALAPLGIQPDDITTCIVTHLHYDHAGGLAHFPNATIHLQAAEMAFATGPCMCESVLRAPFTGIHVCEAVQRLYGGKLIFHDGDAEVTDGVRVHRIGGHSKGLQAVTVLTSQGWICLASDAAHYYENAFAKRPFPLVVDVDDMLAGFDRIINLATAPELMIPGHDPLVRSLFPEGPAPHIRRLDVGPTGTLPDY